MLTWTALTLLYSTLASVTTLALEEELFSLSAAQATN
jgi:hypothetical protein